MNNENSYTEEFDAYIQGQLSAEDMAVFEQKIKSNPEFADAFKKHQLLVELIKENARLELKVYLNTYAKTKVISSNNWLQSKLFAIAATAIILIGAFVVFQYYSSPKLEQNLAIETSLPSPATKRKEPSIERPDVNIIEAPEIYSEKDLLNEMPPPTIEELKSVEMGSLDDAAPPLMEDNAESMKDDAVVDYNIAREIKNKDTFLYAIALTMLNVDGKKESYGFNKTSKTKSAQLPAAASNSNQAKALDEKSNSFDTAVLKKSKISGKESNAKSKYAVEYWSSPVNFKGYRLIYNTIQLYGLDSYNGKLYTVNGSLYLRYSGKVYAIAPCIDACPYKLEVDPDIIQFILNQN